LKFSPSAYFQTITSSSSSTAAGSSSLDSLAAAVDAAACLRCLAAAPRLPAADWSGLCHKLLSLPDPAAATTPIAAAAAAVNAQLQAASTGLLLNHCQVPGLELSGILDACLSPEGLRVLPVQIQTLLLQRLDLALAALPANRAPPVLLRGVVPIVTAATATAAVSGGGGSSSCAASIVVVLSSWVGLARLATAAAAGAPPFIGGSSQLTAALHRCVQQLLPLLPLLPMAAVTPALLQQIVVGDAAGDVQQLMDQQETNLCWLGAAEDSTSSTSSKGVQQLLLVWKAATTCLKLLHPDVQLLLTEPPPHSAAAASVGSSGDSSFARAVQLRSLLVLSGSLDWRSLTSLRNTALQILPAAVASGGSSSSEVVLLALAAAGATASQAGVLKQLQEVAAAARLAAAPVNAAVLTAAMLAAWLAATGSSGGINQAAAAAAAAEQQLVLGNGVRGMLQQLSTVLPQLAAYGGIVGSRQGFVGGVVLVLREVGAAVEERGGEGSVECSKQLTAALYAVHQG
jgi:hypothetical protein